MKLDVKFELNQPLDQQIALEFLGVKFAGLDFSQGIITAHPELKLALGQNKAAQKKIIKNYFDDFYKLNGKKLEACLLKARMNWEKDKDKFIDQLENIFKKPTVPKGKYIGYLSIVNCNPRFLEDKTFQFYYQHKNGSNYIAIHEILHFFFYDYVERNHYDIFGKLNPNSGLYWDLAELFNSVVMSSPDFISEQYWQNTKTYPDHAKYFNQAQAIWNLDYDIGRWLIGMREYLVDLS